MHKSVLIFLIVLFSHSAFAGWILTGRYLDQNGKTIMQRYFIQDYNVKFEQYDIIYTFNLKTHTLILVDPVRLLYYKGTIEKYIEGCLRQKNERLQKLMEEIPADQREEYKTKYSAQFAGFGKPVQVTKDSISIVPLDDSLKVFGKATDKYEIRLNNRKAEELWISPALLINAQFDWRAFLYFISVLEPDNMPLQYMASNPYLDLLGTGFPVRRILVFNGYRNDFQINKAEEKVIPGYEFGIPALCKEVPVSQWINRDQDMNPNYDDYE
ncbi:MAG: hypothetical protein HXX13_00810 [Bacteroidetes bacterium]|nr:hypothetical protein [Bacteroidota bacterium]